MNPEPGGYFNRSLLVKASLLTISLASVYYYKAGRRHFLSVVATPAKDTIQLPPLQKAATKKKKNKTIYLTFDDGPNKGSSKVIDIIKEEQVAATMFVVGEHVYGSGEQKAVWDSMQNSNLIEIANHSYTHAFHNKFANYYSNPTATANDFKRCEDSLHFTTNIARTPGRNIWRTGGVTSTDIKTSTAAADTVKQRGFILMGWDLEWRFTNDHHLVQTDSLLITQIEKMFEKNETKTSGHLVLLMHDRTFLRTNDSASLHCLIKELKKKDLYDFEVVDKYPGLGRQ